MDTILLSQACGKVLLKDKVLKPNINLDAIVSVLMSYGIHDETKYILDLALSETKVKPRNIGDVVKFHYKNYSDRGNPSLSVS
jgi:hypothetical protein